MHELDRLRGPDPPRSIVIDPRETESAREAEVHLAIRPGTNLAVLNGLAQQLIENDWVDREFVDAHTIGFDALEKTVAPYTPERVAEICGVAGRRHPPGGGDPRRGRALLTFVLQGVYQSHQATASACAANNVNLLRGMIGRPGLRDPADERPADGAEHARDGLQRRPARLPQLAERGARRRARRALERRAAADPALGAADARDGDLPLRRAGLDRLPLDQRHEPGGLAARAAADPLDPRAGGALRRRLRRLPDARRRGSPTSFSRPRSGARRPARSRTPTAPSTSPSRRSSRPGEARADMEIFLDYARRLDLRDRDGAPLVKWSTPEECFEAWKECTAGGRATTPGSATTSCAEAAASSGRATRRRPTAPSGSTRICSSRPCPTSARTTGTTSRPARRSPRRNSGRSAPTGRAILKAADWTPPHEWPATNTRSRSPPAAPSTTSTRGRRPAARRSCRRPRRMPGSSLPGRRRAARHRGGRLRARRFAAGLDRGAGARRRPARGRRLRPVPLRLLGLGDGAGPDGRPRAANELTITAWDPVSKQPQLKTAAVKVERAHEDRSLLSTSSRSRPP